MCVILQYILVLVLGLLLHVDLLWSISNWVLLGLNMGTYTARLIKAIENQKHFNPDQCDSIPNIDPLASDTKLAFNCLPLLKYIIDIDGFTINGKIEARELGIYNLHGNTVKTFRFRLSKPLTPYHTHIGRKAVSILCCTTHPQHTIS